MKENSAGKFGGGGAIYNRNNAPFIHKSRFSGNSAESGGAIYNFNSGATISKCVFSLNSSNAGGGGAIYNRDSHPAIIQSSILGNTATSVGGGIMNVESNPLITHCFIEDNVAGFGGGFYNGSSAPSFSNCILSGNRARNQGGGMYNASFGTKTRVALVNCTLARNSSVLGGGGIYNKSEVELSLRNCIVWNNGSQFSNEIHNEGPQAVSDVRFSCIKGGHPGEGNTDEDPLFIATAARGLYLQPGSPCIDSGNNTSILPDTTDIDSDEDFREQTPIDLLGNPRLNDIEVVDNTGLGTAPIVDMGAFEISGQPVISVENNDVLESDGLARIQVNLFWSGISPINLTYAIDDGTARSDADYHGLDGVLQWDTDGAQFLPISIIKDDVPEKNETVLISLTNPTNNATLLKSRATLTILDPDIIYVKANASGADDGTSWSDAFPDLQAALASADSGDQIWVEEGVYTPGSTRSSTFQMVDEVNLYGGFAGDEADLDQRNLDENTTILSGDLEQNDGDHRLANGENAYHVVTGAGNFILDGFTITAGNADTHPDTSGGGIFNFDTSATIRNCYITGNIAADNGGGYLQ